MNPKDYKEALEAYSAFKAAESKKAEDLQHWGIKGMKWGDRKYQYKDGSLTPEGRERYGVGDPKEKARLKMEEESQRAKLEFKRNKAEAKLQMKMDRAAAKNDAIRIKAEQYGTVKESQEKTEQKKIGMQAEKLAEKNRHREAGFGKKLIMAGVATVAAVAVIKALRNNASSPEVNALAEKGKNVIKEKKEVKETLTKSVKDVAEAAKEKAKANPNAGRDLDKILSNMDATKYLKPGALDHPKTYNVIGPISGLYTAGAMTVNKIREFRHSDIRVVRIPKEVYDHVIT